MQSTTLTAKFVYDGNGTRVKATLGATTTAFAGSHYEVTGGVVKKYYFAGSARIALRDNGIVYYLFGDHLGSTSITATSGGAEYTELRYTAWGEVRWSSATATPTKYQFTGQYSYAADFGLLYFGARWVDPSIGHFAQADSLIPGAGNVLAFDRYGYALENPLRFNDPTGHVQACADGDDESCQGGIPDYLKQLTTMYDIKFSGAWARAKMWTVFRAIMAIGSKMAGVIGGTSWDVFRSVFGGLTLTLDSSLAAKGLYGQASVDNIRLDPENISGRLLGHELGHVFSMRMHRSSGDIYTDNHPEMMLNSGLWDGDTFMTGENRSVEGSPYERNGLVLGPESGYVCDTLPCQYHLMEEGTPEESVNYMDEDSLSAKEEWADMFLNWSLSGFTNTDRGRFYTNWMTMNMSDWISMARGW